MATENNKLKNETTARITLTVPISLFNEANELVRNGEFSSRSAVFLHWLRMGHDSSKFLTITARYYQLHMDNEAAVQKEITRQMRKRELRGLPL